MNKDRNARDCEYAKTSNSTLSTTQEPKQLIKTGTLVRRPIADCRDSWPRKEIECASFNL